MYRSDSAYTSRSESYSRDTAYSRESTYSRDSGFTRDGSYSSRPPIDTSTLRSSRLASSTAKTSDPPPASSSNTPEVTTDKNHNLANDEAEPTTNETATSTSTATTTTLEPDASLASTDTSDDSQVSTPHTRILTSFTHPIFLGIIKFIISFNYVHALYRSAFLLFPVFIFYLLFLVWSDKGILKGYTLFYIHIFLC